MGGRMSEGSVRLSISSRQEASDPELDVCAGVGPPYGVREDLFPRRPDVSIARYASTDGALSNSSLARDSRETERREVCCLSRRQIGFRLFA